MKSRALRSLLLTVVFATSILVPIAAAQQRTLALLRDRIGKLRARIAVSEISRSPEARELRRQIDQLDDDLFNYEDPPPSGVYSRFASRLNALEGKVDTALRRSTAPPPAEVAEGVVEPPLPAPPKPSQPVLAPATPAPQPQAAQKPSEVTAPAASTAPAPAQKIAIADGRQPTASSPRPQAAPQIPSQQPSRESQSPSVKPPPASSPATRAAEVPKKEPVPSQRVSPPLPEPEVSLAPVTSPAPPPSTQRATAPAQMPPAAPAASPAPPSSPQRTTAPAPAVPAGPAPARPPSTPPPASPSVSATEPPGMGPRPASQPAPAKPVSTVEPAPKEPVKPAAAPRTAPAAPVTVEPEQREPVKPLPQPERAPSPALPAVAPAPPPASVATRPAEQPSFATPVTPAVVQPSTAPPPAPVVPPPVASVLPAPAPAPQLVEETMTPVPAPAPIPASEPKVPAAVIAAAEPQPRITASRPVPARTTPSKPAANDVKLSTDLPTEVVESPEAEANPADDAATEVVAVATELPTPVVPDQEPAIPQIAQAQPVELLPASPSVVSEPQPAPPQVPTPAPQLVPPVIVQPAPSASAGVTIPTATVAPPPPSLVVPQLEATSRPAPARAQSAPPRIAESPDHGRALAVDVAQGAAGAFRDIDAVVSYIHENGIASVNIDPGTAPNETLPALRRAVGPLRTAGARVKFLYGQLHYPLRGYAELLVAHKDHLGIDTIVDRSSLTDASRSAFEEKTAAARAVGLRYSAFVPLASRPDVSDETRRWAIENLDEPILASYASCAVPGDGGQAEVLRPWMVLADELVRTGRRDPGFLTIAILIGSRTGERERACDQDLDPVELPLFFQELDRWARQFKAFGGVVIETKHETPGAW